jgi:hypothetical protein
MTWTGTVHIRTSKKVNVLHLYRDLLRATTYLPDSLARRSFPGYLRTRFERTKVVTDGRLATARKGLNKLRAAAEGQSKPLYSVLRLTYGRSGPWRRRLLTQLRLVDSEITGAPVPGYEGLPIPSTNGVPRNHSPGVFRMKDELKVEWEIDKAAEARLNDNADIAALIKEGLRQAAEQEQGGRHEKLEAELEAKKNAEDVLDDEADIDAFAQAEAYEAAEANRQAGALSGGSESNLNSTSTTPPSAVPGNNGLSGQSSSAPSNSLSAVKPSPLIVFLLSQKSESNIDPISILKIRATNPSLSIPREGIWGRPLPIKRQRNLVKQFWKTSFQRIMPPMPERHWNRLRDLATGKLKEKVVIPRRKAGRVLERDTCGAIIGFGGDSRDADPTATLGSHTDPNEGRGELLIVPSVASLKSPAYIHLKKAKGKDGHIITHRLMQRAWGTIWSQCAKMQRTDDKASRTGWKIEWGGSMSASSRGEISRVVRKEDMELFESSGKEGNMHVGLNRKGRAKKVHESREKKDEKARMKQERTEIWLVRKAIDGEPTGSQDDQA